MPPNTHAAVEKHNIEEAIRKILIAAGSPLTAVHPGSRTSCFIDDRCVRWPVVQYII